MGPIIITITLERPARPGLHPLHLDAPIIVAQQLRAKRKASAIDRSTPIDKVRRIDASGLLHLHLEGQHCHATTAAGVSADGRTVKWYAYGNRGTVLRAIRLLWRDGVVVLDDKEHAVTGCKVEHGEHDLADVFVGTKGRAVRHLPEQWVASAEAWGEGAHEGPYWHPGRQHRTPKLGSVAELDEGIRQAVHRVDREHTEAVARQQDLTLRSVAARRLEAWDAPREPQPQEPRARERLWDDDDRPLPHIEQRVRELCQGGSTDEEIGAAFGFSARTGRRLRQRSGVLRAPSPAPSVSDARIRELVSMGLSTVEIAQRTGYTYRTVQEVLFKLQLKANPSVSGTGVLAVSLPLDLMTLLRTEVDANELDRWIATAIEEKLGDSSSP